MVLSSTILILYSHQSPLSSSRTSITLLSASVDLLVLDISNKWNNTVCELLCLASVI